MTKFKNYLSYYLVILASLLSIATAEALPTRVIIIRNAEAPIVPKIHPDLAAKGQERAALLPFYFSQFNQENPIAAVYATSPSMAHPAQRPAETCSPTAKALGLKLELHYVHGEETKLAQAIKNNPAYQNKTVVICWQHGMIPALAAALGVKNPPKPWPDNAFDKTWVIDFLPDGSTELTVSSQKLLYGDSSTATIRY